MLSLDCVAWIWHLIIILYLAIPLTDTIIISGLQKQPTLDSVQQMSYHGCQSEKSAEEGELPSPCISKSIVIGSEDRICDSCGDDPVLPQALCVTRVQLNPNSSKGHAKSLYQEGRCYNNICQKFVNR